jgi:hypothetical protein
MCAPPARTRDDSAIMRSSRGRELRSNRLRAMRSLARSSERRNAAPAGPGGCRQKSRGRLSDLCRNPGRSSLRPGISNRSGLAQFPSSHDEHLPPPSWGRVGVGAVLSTEDRAKLTRRRPHSTLPRPGAGQSHVKQRALQSPPPNWGRLGRGKPRFSAKQSSLASPTSILPQFEGGGNMLAFPYAIALRLGGGGARIAAERPLLYETVRLP